MAQYKRNLVESTDPVTGERVYRDAETGEIVTPDVVHQYSVSEQTSTPVGHVTERSVTEHTNPALGPNVTRREYVATPPAYASGTHMQESEVYTEDPYARRRDQVAKLQQAVYLLFGILEGLLAIRFVLRALAANPESGFASFIYGITAPFMWPFAALFPQPAIGGSVVEWNDLVAIIVYALIAWVLAKLIWLAAGESRSGVRTSRVNTRIDQ